MGKIYTQIGLVKWLTLDLVDVPEYWGIYDDEDLITFL